MAQKVKLGLTQSGKPGLFTNGMLAWGLKPEQFEKFVQDRAALERFADNLYFELEPEEPGDADDLLRAVTLLTAGA